MAENISELSLQSLYELVQTKANKEHNHVIVGSIESALMLGGVPAERYLRNDLSNQIVSSHNDDASFTVESEKSSVKLEAGRNKALLVVGDKQMSKHALTVTGTHTEPVVVNVNGSLNVNNEKVLTVNEAGELTGLDLKSLNLEGQGIIVSANEPANPTDGTIWARVIEDDIETDLIGPDGALKVLSLPVGSIVDWLGTTIPNGFILADGGLYSRVVYGKLWNHAKNRTRLLDDVTWQSKKQENNPVEFYSAGDRSTVFRVPYLPTGSTAVKLIKAYDEPTTQEMINIDALQKAVTRAIETCAATGVGYIKFASGELLQYGTTLINGKALFSLPFIDTNYMVFPGIEETTLATAQVDPASKTATQCMMMVFNDVGVRVDRKTRYMAFGRWK